MDKDYWQLKKEARILQRNVAKLEACIETSMQCKALINDAIREILKSGDGDAEGAQFQMWRKNLAFEERSEKFFQDFLADEQRKLDDILSRITKWNQSWIASVNPPTATPDATSESN